MTLPNAIHLRISLAALVSIARDLRRDGGHECGAWRGVIRQVRRCADELRWVKRERAVANDARNPS